MPAWLPRFLKALAGALVIAAIATALLWFGWKAAGGETLGLHGTIALSIGVTGTVALAWGLMALAFKSSREGWDDRVDNSLDPGRKQDEGEP